MSGLETPRGGGFQLHTTPCLQSRSSDAAWLAHRINGLFKSELCLGTWDQPEIIKDFLSKARRDWGLRRGANNTGEEAAENAHMGPENFPVAR